MNKNVEQIGLTNFRFFKPTNKPISGSTTWLKIVTVWRRSWLVLFSRTHNRWQIQDRGSRDGGQEGPRQPWIHRCVPSPPPPPWIHHCAPSPHLDSPSSDHSISLSPPPITWRPSRLSSAWIILCSLAGSSITCRKGSNGVSDPVFAIAFRIRIRYADPDYLKTV